MSPYTFYTTVENQLRENGTYGLLYDHFEDINRAYAKFYTILAAAAMSEIPYHAGYLIRSDGVTIEGKVFDRRVAPVAEPEEETPQANGETEPQPATDPNAKEGDGE